MLHDILWYTLGLILLVSAVLYVFETLPQIRRRRAIDLRDWGFGFGLFKPMNNLKEYKEICEQERKSLIWYRVQVYLFLAFIGIGLLWVFMPIR